MKKKLFFLASILAAVGLLAGAYFIWVRPKTLGEGEKTVTLEIVTRDKSYVRQVKTNGGMAVDALMDVKDEIQFAYTDYGWGIGVNGFYGVNYNFGDEYTYKFFINGEESMRGVSAEPIQDGDTLSFLLIAADDWATAGYHEVKAVNPDLWIFFVVAVVAVVGAVIAYIFIMRRKDKDTDTPAV